MQLAVRQEDADILLKQKNVLMSLLLKNIGRWSNNPDCLSIYHIIDKQLLPFTNIPKVDYSAVVFINRFILLKLLSRQYVNKVNEKVSPTQQQ